MSRRTSNTLLPHVLRAVATLLESGGSTTNDISRFVLQHYRHSERNATRDPRVFSLQIHRALKDGVRSGVLARRSGKFTLGTKVCYPKKSGHGSSRRKSKTNTKTKGRKFRKRRKFGRNKSSSCTSCTSNPESTSDAESNSTDESGKRQHRKHKRKYHRRGRDPTREPESPTGDNSTENNRASKTEPSPEPNQQEPIQPDDGLPSTSTGFRRSVGRPRLRHRTHINKLHQHKDKHRGGITIHADTRKSRSRQELNQHKDKHRGGITIHADTRKSRSRQGHLNLTSITDEQMSPANCGNPNCICNFKTEGNDDEFSQQENEDNQ